MSEPVPEPGRARPGRYQRSFSGLVASLVVTLLAIGAFVVFRATFRQELERRPEPVDYLAAVGYAQEAGVEVVYPATLPEGWIATSVDLEPGSARAWGLGLLTDEGQYVGVRQEGGDLGDIEDLLATYVEEQPADIQRLGEVALDSEVADDWQAFTDSGGDRAYAAETGEDVVLVYGSAPEEDVVALVERLTQEPR